MLTDNEMKYAENLMALIEKRGFNNLAKTEFDAGCISGREFDNVVQYLKEIKWKYVKEFLKEDKNVLEIGEKPVERKRKNKTTIDADLNRRLRNLYTRQEFAELGIKDMSYSEAEQLAKKREKELLNGKRGFGLLRG